MKRRSIVVTAVAIVFGTVLALLIPSPAVGFYSPPLLLDVRVAPTGELLARGAAVEVRLEVTCGGATSDVYVAVHVTQRVGSGIASGSASTEIPCAPQQQTVLMVVSSDSDKAFRQGTALVEGYVSACHYDYPYFCGSETDSQTISIER